MLVREEAVSLREVAVESRERMLAATAAGVNQANMLKSDIEKVHYHTLNELECESHYQMNPAHIAYVFSLLW